MPTENPRVNITFQAQTVKALNSIAQREKKSLSSVAKELILEALELREDMSLSSLAKLRDSEGLETIRHVDVWK